jgi:hypothetical protein
MYTKDTEVAMLTSLETVHIVKGVLIAHYCRTVRADSQDVLDELVPRSVASGFM